MELTDDKRADLDRFVGKALGDVFLEHVIFDATLKTLVEEISPKHRDWWAVFKDGRAPGPIVHFKWDLSLTADQLAFQALPNIFHPIAPHLNEPDMASLQIAEHVALRLIEFRRWLTEGDLSVIGTSAFDEQVRPIDRFQWGRDSVRLDVKNSDLYEKRGHDLVVRFTGLSVALSHVKPLVDDGQPLSPTASPPKQRNSTKGRSRIETKMKSRKACEDWLVSIFERSPEVPLYTKGELWEQARKLWEGSLAETAFLEAWDAAVDRAKAHNWTKPGRRAKPPKSIVEP